MVSVEGIILQQIECILQIPRGNANHSLSFVALGGSSLDAVILSQACKKAGISLSVHDILRSPSLSCMVKTACAQSGGGTSGQHLVDCNGLITKGVNQTSKQYPMTEMQLALIQGTNLRPGTNTIRHIQTCSPDQIPMLKRAWQRVLQGEPIFRTEFHLHNGDGYLVETEHAPFDWEEVVAQSSEEYLSILEETPLGTGVNSRFKVVLQAYNGSDRAIACIIWSVHHALIDGYSMDILLTKVERVARGQLITPGPSFGHISNQLQRLQRSMKHQGQAFWERQRERFPGASATLLLPPPREVPRIASSQCQSVSPTMTASQFQCYAKSLGVTVASIYLGAWALVVSQFGDSDTVVFGTVVSGRNLQLPGAAETVGPLMNTLPLHVTLKKSDMSSTELLRDVFAQLIEVASFHWTTPEHGFSRDFSSAVAMQFDVAMDTNITGSHSYQGSKTLINSDIPLSILVLPDGTINIHYLDTHFSADQIDLLGQQYDNALRVLCRPSYTIEMCLEDLLSPSLRKRLLVYGNCHSGLTTETSVHDDLVTLYERTSALHPDKVAIEHGDQRMTYQQLNLMSSHIASYLKNIAKMEDGEVVCVHADQTMNWIAAIYGILKAGGVYCALNQNLTPDLRCSMFESSGSRTFLVPNACRMPPKPRTCESLIVLDDLLPNGRNTATHNHLAWGPREHPTPAATAYLCFTSGSTGKPKAVICTHRGLVAFQRDLEVRLFAEPGRRVAQLMSVAFDGSIHELFSALSYGATLVLPEPSDPFGHLRQVDAAILTPSVAALLRPDEFPRLQYVSQSWPTANGKSLTVKQVYLVGEQVSQDINDLWGVSKQLYNMYGPTESTCGATIKRLLPGTPVTIGRCNPTTRVYVLSRKRRLVPPGAIGEIYLAGVQVSNGYLNRPDATKERFFDDNICCGLGERMYATGDMGYWSSSGELTCLGRNDRQIKLRGFRLDLDDLEARISRLPGVTAAALARSDDYLVAMLQPSNLCISQIRDQLADILPVHAIPKRIAAVEQFPMTTAGKRNYKEIVAQACRSSDGSGHRPSSAYEREIAGIWEELLETPSTVAITLDSSFTGLGGHSILQLRLASRLSAAFDCDITPRIVIQADTLREMVREVERLDGRKKPSAEPSSVSRENQKARCSQLSPLEAEWVTKYRTNCGTSAFNVSFAYRLGKGGKEALRWKMVNAWNKVLAKHQILRSRYIQRRPGHGRRAYFESPPQVELVQYLDLWKEVNRPFQLETGYPIRVVASPDVFAVTATHTICDLTTMQILLSEVAALCNGATGLCINQEYMASRVWAESASDEDDEFWASYLDGLPAANAPLLPGLATDRQNYHGTSSIFTLPRESSSNMSRYVHQANITLHQLSLAAVALALNPDADAIDLLLGAPHLNRPSVDDMGTVGLFLEPLGVRVQFEKDSGRSTLSFLEAVKRSSQAALAHAAPWTQLWRRLDADTEFPNHPLFDVMVTFHAQQDTVRFPLDGVQPLYTWADGSKFKLLFEFAAVSSKCILLRIEYDKMLFSAWDIARTGHLIRTALDLLVRDSSWKETQEALRAAMASEPDTSQQLDSRAVFGARVDDLCCAGRN